MVRFPYIFGPFRLTADPPMLTCNGDPVRMPRAVQVLLRLVYSHPKPVPHPTFVDDGFQPSAADRSAKAPGSLRFQINRLNKLFGTYYRTPCIVAISGTGYLWTLEVPQECSDADLLCSLVRLRDATTPEAVHDLVAPLIHTYDVLASLCLELRLCDNRSAILGAAAELVIDGSSSNINAAGILTTLLSNNFDHWHPSPAVLTKLHDVCRRPINADDWSHVSVIEPLAFALGGKGRLSAERNLLGRFVANPHWRRADQDRLQQYYGNDYRQLNAIKRHWLEERRTGLLHAHDVWRLMQLSTDGRLLVAQPSIHRLLEQHIEGLAEAGALELARDAHAFVVNHQSAGDKAD